MLALIDTWTDSNVVCAYLNWCWGYVGSGLGSNMPKSNALTAAAATAFMESRARGVNARDEKGRTALHFASGMASPECARLLLEAGADANVRAKDGLTPIHMAAGYGRCQCVRLLLEHGNRPQSEVASFPNSWSSKRETGPCSFWSVVSRMDYS